MTKLLTLARAALLSFIIASPVIAHAATPSATVPGIDTLQNQIGFAIQGATVMEMNPNGLMFPGASDYLNVRSLQTLINLLNTNCPNGAYITKVNATTFTCTVPPGTGGTGGTTTADANANATCNSGSASASSSASSSSSSTTSGQSSNVSGTNTTTGLTTNTAGVIARSY